MSDMAATIIPKSDQLNADDLIAGPMTIKITGVAIRGGQEQPISISFEGDGGKPYKACKSMCRVMVTAWGPDSSKYTGRSMTLYREPTVKWGGMEVGGIRISHMSDIESAITLALTMTRANKKPFTVRPLAQSKAPPASVVSAPQTGGEAAGAADDGVSATDEFTLEVILADGKEIAEKGMPSYEKWWKGLLPGERKAIGTARHEQMKAIAAEVPTGAEGERV